MLMFHLTYHEKGEEPCLDPMVYEATNGIIPELFTQLPANQSMEDTVEGLLEKLSLSDRVVLRFLDVSSQIAVLRGGNLELSMKTKTTRIYSPEQVKALLIALTNALASDLLGLLRVLPVVKCYVVEDPGNLELRKFAYEQVKLGPKSVVNLVDDNTWAVTSDILRPDIHKGILNVCSYHMSKVKKDYYTPQKYIERQFSVLSDKFGTKTA